MIYRDLTFKNFGSSNMNKIYFIFFVIAAIFALNIIPLPVLSPILIFLTGLAIGIVIIFLFAHDDARFLLNVFLAGFGIRIFLSLFFYLASFVIPDTRSPGFLFQNDGWLYSEQGWQLYQFAERGIRITKEQFLYNPNIQAMSGNITNYDYFSGFVYSITGYSPLSLFFISSIAGSLAAIFIYLIAKELFSKNVARISSLFAFFWPSFILWSTQNLKEPVIAMFTFIFLWSLFSMRAHSFPLFSLLSIVSIAALMQVGLPVAAIIAGALFCSGLFLLADRILKDRFLAFLITGVLILFTVIFFKDKILDFIHKRGSYNILSYKSVFEFLEYHRGVRAYGNLKFFQNFDISSPVKALSFAPLGLVFAIFAPFPWQIGNIMQIMAVPETLIFYMLFPCTVKGIIFAFKKRFEESALILVVIAAMLIFLALIEGNSGTLFRHRAVVFYLIFIFTAMGITLKDGK